MNWSILPYIWKVSQHMRKKRIEIDFSDKQNGQKSELTRKLQSLHPNRNTTCSSVYTPSVILNFLNIQLHLNRDLQSKFSYLVIIKLNIREIWERQFLSKWNIGCFC